MQQRAREPGPRLLAERQLAEGLPRQRPELEALDHAVDGAAGAPYRPA